MADLIYIQHLLGIVKDELNLIDSFLYCPRYILIIQSLLYFPVPIEAYAFLGAVAAFLIILVVFFLYLNKKLCFSECGGFPCIDQPPKKDTSKIKGLGKSAILSIIIFVPIFFNLLCPFSVDEDDLRLLKEDE